MTRYFIVFYQANTASGYAIGSMDFKVTSDKEGGGYINYDKTIEQIKDKNPQITSVVLTNIIELNESDYNDYTSKQ